MGQLVGGVGDLNNIGKRTSSVAIFVMEFTSLLLLSLLITYLVSDLGAPATGPRASCDLGFTKYVPYIAHNEARFCSLPPEASQLVALYFILVTSTILVSEVLYRRSKYKPVAGVTRTHTIGVGLLFWIAISVWFFGLEGRQGDYEFLTQSLHFKAIILCFVTSLSQFLMAIIRQSRRI